MSPKELDAIKYYLNFYQARRFIWASLPSYFLLILFVKKPVREIRF